MTFCICLGVYEAHSCCQYPYVVVLNTNKDPCDNLVMSHSV